MDIPTDRILFYFNAGDSSKTKRILGKNFDISGDCSGLYGNCTGLSGDCESLTGDCSWLEGDCSGVGGDCTGIIGNCTGLIGNFNCNKLTIADREKGVHIFELINF